MWIPVFRCEFILWSNHRNQEREKRPLGREEVAQERKTVRHRSVVRKTGTEG